MYLKACVDLVRGDTEKARTEFEAARPPIEKTVANSPQDATRRAQLGLLYAFLGRREDSLRECQRAMDLTAIAHDVIERETVQDLYALRCARMGDTDREIYEIEHF